MIQRATQTPEYWGESFSIVEQDIEHVLNVFMEDELPRTDDELAMEVVRRRCQREDVAISHELAKGELYRPKTHFELDQQVVFPALDYAVGQVVAVRPGANPDYGPFNVIRVKFDGKLGEREFAADFDYSHRLNEESAESSLPPTADGARSCQELYAAYGANVREKLVAMLRGSQDFAWLFGKWFPRSLVADVNVGHLNLAEAVLDMAGGGPLPTGALLKDVSMPAEINPHLQEFSLNYAMSRDERFDEVGPTGVVLWFLRRLEPPEAVMPPKRLLAASVPYRRDLLDDTLQRIERELDDEYSDLPAGDEETDELTWVLTYPHRRTGSLPLSARMARLFPTGRTHRIRLTFEDARSGNRWIGWVVREHRFAFGLDTWYEANEIPVGAYLQLRRGDEPDVVVIDWQGRRPKRDWVRVAAPRENGLSFEMLKRQVNCECDELMLMWVDNMSMFDEAVQRWARGNLNDIVMQVFPNLAKLSPQGAVHAKTIYSALNLLRRVVPGPLFAEVMLNPSLRPVGDGYWVLAD